MAEVVQSSEIYRLHVMLLHINPPIWRRLLVRSNTSIADLHDILQISFEWTDFHLHRFLIRGKEYGVGRAGCTSFSTDARKTLLSHFRFRLNERFLYEYDFRDLWQHQVRIEGIELFEQKKVYPVCISGVNAAPPEDCGGPKAYMDRIEHHWLNPPLEALEVIADAVRVVLKSREEENIRDQIGDLDALQEAVEELKAYQRFRPERFDRRRVTRRLKQYAHGDDGWKWEVISA